MFLVKGTNLVIPSLLPKIIFPLIKLTHLAGTSTCTYQQGMGAKYSFLLPRRCINQTLDDAETDVTQPRLNISMSFSLPHQLRMIAVGIKGKGKQAVWLLVTYNYLVEPYW